MTSQLAERSSSEAGGQSSSQQHSQSERTIPIYFRLVPKDVWVRMHVDTKATIGAIKDTFLESIDMAPYDPTLQANFYDDARWAMTRQNTPQHEARTLPKAFVARAPKRGIKDVLKMEAEYDAVNLFTSESSKSPGIARKTPAVKTVPASGQARAILGGEAGLGGRGRLGFVSAFRALDDDISHLEDVPANHASPVSSHMSPSMHSYATPDFRKVGQRPFLPLQAAGTPNNPLVQRTRSLNIADRPGPADSPATSSYDTSLLMKGDAVNHDLVASGLVDAEALRRLDGRLPGNEDAKRLERLAILNIKEARTAQDSRKQLDSSTVQVPAVNEASTTSRASISSVEHNEVFQPERVVAGDGKADITVDGSTRQESLRSSASSVVEDGVYPDLSAMEGTEPGMLSNPAVSEKAARPASPSSGVGAGERARSGTIVPTEAQRRAALNANVLAQGSSTPSTINTMSSNDMQVPDADLTKLPLPHFATASESHIQASPLRTETQVSSSLPGPASGGVLPPNVRRLAGIHTDEISSWRDAQHGQARHFAIHSFSNGHVLEDWRTVAALRLKPYELLEVQYADIREKVHLPRCGEAVNVCTRKGLPKVEKEIIATSFGPSIIGENPSLDTQYLEPYAESWAYIFKRGSGTSRTQRAGLGLWKLRWLCLHSNRVFVFRSKPPRFAFDEAIMVWNLDCIDTVFSERADGATRPHLPIIGGQCQDILTLTFRPPIGTMAVDDNLDDSQLSVSMRFVTQLDHVAFFKSCSRAHYRAAYRRRDTHQAMSVFEWRRRALARATIAGMGGTVMPGKASRRGGRNALSRPRLRPTGIKRDFDDADRWSSGSETEDFEANGATAQDPDGRPAFRYTEAALSTLPPNVEASGLPYTPVTALPSGSYFTLETSETGGENRFRSSSPVTPSFAMLRKASARQRGFTTSTVPNGVDDSSRPGRQQETTPAQLRLQHAFSMRSLSSQNVGLGVSTDAPPASPSPLGKLSPSERATPSLTVSPVVGADVVEEHRFAKRDGQTTAPLESTISAVDRANASATNSQNASPSSHRPIVSPELELEQSPAAQALHSFLAQRSSSRASNLSRSRSATIAASPKDRREEEFPLFEQEPIFSFDQHRQNRSPANVNGSAAIKTNQHHFSPVSPVHLQE